MNLPEKKAEDPEIIVAGHSCLDIIPRLPPGNCDFHPGALREIGEATISPGGCVSNTGIALARLGARVQLVSRIGDDLLGDLLRQCLSQQGGCADAMSRVPGEHTSYSVILSPEGKDRMVLHFPGTNQNFDRSDLARAFSHPGKLFHFGYPPLMWRVCREEGAELAALLHSAQAAGMITSLDMASIDPSTSAGKLDWNAVLSHALPYVDLFVPSYEEIVHMLDPGGAPPLYVDEPDAALLAQLEDVTSSLLAMGARIIGIKLGTRGLYLRTGNHARLARLAHMLDVQQWGDRELWTKVFDARVAGTNGAGDATIAGFLFGFLRGFSPERVCIAACAVGGCSVEAEDATSGIPNWDTVEARIAAGWGTKDNAFLNSMTEIAPGVFCGPLEGRGRPPGHEDLAAAASVAARRNAKRR